jgi:spermidine synthase
VVVHLKLRLHPSQRTHSLRDNFVHISFSVISPPVKPFELLAETLLPDGTLMKLTRRGDEYFILADGLTLMSSRAHNSEEALARLSCQRARALKKPSVLIGGLGMGFTLRATLDLLPPAAKVVVAELVPQVVEWNRGPLGPLAGNPLNDQRVRVDVANVADSLSSAPAQFDVVILDVDNGPAAFTAEKNAALYDHDGIADTRRALNPGGVLAVWAARQDPTFVQRLRNARFTAEVHHVRGHTNNRGPRHTIYIGHKS